MTSHFENFVAVLLIATVASGISFLYIELALGLFGVRLR
jgi:hypothetical protein